MLKRSNFVGKFLVIMPSKFDFLRLLKIGAVTYFREESSEVPWIKVRSYFDKKKSGNQVGSLVISRNCKNASKCFFLCRSLVMNLLWHLSSNRRKKILCRTKVSQHLKRRESSVVKQMQMRWQLKKQLAIKWPTLKWTPFLFPTIFSTHSSAAWPLLACGCFLAPPFIDSRAA